MEAYRTQYAHFTINFPTKTMMDKKNLLTFANETHLIAYKLQSSDNASMLQPNIHIYIFAEVAHIEGDWTIVDNFRLFYLGTDIPDAIDNVNDREGSFAEASDIRTINGLRVSAPVRGINIVRKGNSYVKVIKMKD